MNKAADDDEEPVLCFSLDLRFTHPTMRAEIISQEFGLQPDIMWNAGDRRMTPNGVALSGSRKWTYWIKTEDIYGKRAFFQSAVDTAARFEKHKPFLKNFSATGGEAMIVIALDGARNIGDVIRSDGLRVLSDLGFSLGLEVFPDFGRSTNARRPEKG